MPDRPRPLGALLLGHHAGAGTQRAKANYALAKTLNRLDRFALLVINNIGYVRKDEAETSVLFELVMYRYERRSLLVTSNQPFREWENVFSTSDMTVAAVDRLVDHSTLIQINGERYRRVRVRRAGGLANSKFAAMTRRQLPANRQPDPGARCR